MRDDEYLKSVRRGLKASVRFFESKNKQRRERFVVREFLLNLGQQFLARDLKTPPDDPPDVRFEDCNFEIKEHMDRGRERHREYKEALKKADAATDASQLLKRFTPIDISLGDIYALVLTDAQLLAVKKYPSAVRRRLDLLVYVNLQDVMGMVVTPLPDTAALTSLGWRSVSFVKGHWSCVLTAADDAPDLLRDAMGKLVHRNQPVPRPHLNRRSTSTRRKRRAG